MSVAADPQWFEQGGRGSRGSGSWEIKKVTDSIRQLESRSLEIRVNGRGGY